MSSILNVDTIATKNGTSPVSFTKQQAAKLVAGCTLAGSLNSASSLNVSSLADGGTGLNTVNATNAFQRKLLKLQYLVRLSMMLFILGQLILMILLLQLL